MNTAIRSENQIAGGWKARDSHGKEKNRIDYLKGANIAGFVKVADAMLAQGVV